MVRVVKANDEKGLGEVSPSEFEKMLKETPQLGSVQPGEMVSGVVVGIGEDMVFVDIGCKSEGTLSLEEFKDESGEVKVKVGDRVEATVLTLRGGIRLSRSLRKSQQTIEVLQDAYENRIPVEGRVTGVRKGGFSVEVGSGLAAFCPISQIDLKYVEGGAEYVGRTFNFRIIKFDPGSKNVVVSRRVLLEEEQEAQARETRNRLKPGALLDGTVKKVTSFGAFVDLGGVDGLVHVSELAWDRVVNPEDVVTPGLKVRVKVLSIDPETGKIALSMREAGPDPWDEIETRFPVSSSTTGVISRVEPYGAFVKLAPGIEGLVHVSEMTWLGRVRHAGDVVKVGDSVKVVVLDIDRERKRIALGIKQTQVDPFESVVEKYAPGKGVTGTVQRIGSGGVFIELEGGIVAFLPASLAGIARGEPLGSAYKPGKTVTLRVREVDTERHRITLEAGEAETEEERNEFESYMKSQGVTKLGSFGELLQKALKDRKKK